MPIVRRVLPPAATYTHRIITPHFTEGITVKHERVVAAAPQLHWTMGHRYDKIRETCSSRNWTLEKLEPKPKGK